MYLFKFAQALKDPCSLVQCFVTQYSLKILTLGQSMVQIIRKHLPKNTWKSFFRTSFGWCKNVVILFLDSLNWQSVNSTSLLNSFRMDLSSLSIPLFAIIKLILKILQEIWRSFIILFFNYALHRNQTTAKY